MAIVRGRTLKGNANDNILLANEAAADSLFQEQYGGWYTAWNRIIDGLNGNDLIIRDQPGDYTESAYFNFKWNDEWTEFYLNGNAVISGGSGNDTVSYAGFSSAMDIDLRPVAQQTAEEPGFWNGAADVSGMAKVKGIAPEGIFGHDYLVSIENVFGTNYNDLINGNSGSNRLEGRGGNDALKGHEGNDSMKGGDGNDSIWGGEGHDSFSGDDGNDLLNGGAGNDGITGGAGQDTINGGAGNDIMAGGIGNDTMRGGDGNDWIYGGGDQDRAYGQGGNDSIYLQGSGGWGYGGEGSDKVFGGDGDDYINTGRFLEGNDEAHGGAGDDSLIVGLGDLADGGSGTDRLILKNTADMYAGIEVIIDANGDGVFGWAYGNGPGDIGQLVSIENVKTGGGDDKVEMRGSGKNRIDTGSGDDLVQSHDGNDNVRTRSGDDSVEAGNGNDTVHAGGGNDRVDAGEGDDSVNAGSGNDTVLGGEGEDILTGGSGADGFVWKDGDHGIDTITDFQIGTDYIGIQDYLESPVPIGGSYVGKVFALQTWDGSATALTAKTDDGWKSFARLEGLGVEEVWSAIQDGSLFGGSYSGGPGDYVPLSGLNTSLVEGDPFLAIDPALSVGVDDFALI